MDRRIFMLENLDELMTKHCLEAIIIHGESTYHNPEFFFVTRTHIPRGGIYFKKVDEKPILIVSEIDLENAKQGVIKRVLSYSEKNLDRYIITHGINGRKYIFQKLIREEGVAGKIGFYGRNEVNTNISIVNSLMKMGYKIDYTNSAVLKEAMATKSNIEIEALNRIGKLCEKVILKVLGLFGDCTSDGNMLRFEGKSVTVGFVKSFINRFLAEYRLFPDKEYILSTGTKTSEPHYPGKDNELIKRNEPVLIDLFPRGTDNLYFDITRTFVIGKANKKLKEMYNSVVEVHDSILDMIYDGAISGEVMNLACKIFEKRGHETLRKAILQSNLKNGFIHSLGHGVGWTLSDKPSISLFGSDKIKRGNVLTVEPGLYYKEVGGVRLEDVIAVKGKRIFKLSKLEIPFEV